METSLSRDQLKELLKTAIAAVLEERRDLLRELIEEAIEDIALARAIEESQTTETVPRIRYSGSFKGNVRAEFRFSFAKTYQ